MQNKHTVKTQIFLVKLTEQQALSENKTNGLLIEITEIIYRTVREASTKPTVQEAQLLQRGRAMPRVVEYFR